MAAVSYTLQVVGGPMDGKTLEISGDPEKAADQMVLGFVEQGVSSHHGVYRRGWPTLGRTGLGRKERIVKWRYEFIEELKR